MEQGWRFLSWVNEWANSSMNTFINSTNMWWAPTMCQVSTSMSYVLGGEYRGDKAEFLPHWKQNVQWTPLDFMRLSWGFPPFLPSLFFSLFFKVGSPVQWKMWRDGHHLAMSLFVFISAQDEGVRKPGPPHFKQLGNAKPLLPGHTAHQQSS